LLNFFEVTEYLSAYLYHYSKAFAFDTIPLLHNLR